MGLQMDIFSFFSFFFSLFSFFFFFFFFSTPLTGVSLSYRKHCGEGVGCGSFAEYVILFLHILQTSITQSLFKLEHFLRPFFKTRSHGKSAHTFGSSSRFLQVPQKGHLKQNFTSLAELWHSEQCFFLFLCKQDSYHCW